jgi:hypothetical protein
MTRAVKYAMACLLIFVSVAGTLGLASYVRYEVAIVFAWCMGGAFGMSVPAMREVIRG